MTGEQPEGWRGPSEGTVADLFRRLVDRSREVSARSARHEQVQGLLDLAGQLEGILVAVQPRIRFRDRLKIDLIRGAQSRPPLTSAQEQRRRGLLIGAIVGSLASITGVTIALILHFRHNRATHAA